MPAFVAMALLSGAVSGYLAVGAFTILNAAFYTALAVGALGYALAKKPQTPSSGSLAYSSANQMLTIKQPAAPWRVIYGESRVGGVLTFLYSSEYQAANQSLSSVITIAGHPVESIDDIYFDDVLVPFAGEGIYTASGKYASRVIFWKNLDGLTAAAIADLVIRSGGKWTTAHTQSGRASLYTLLLKADGLFQSGVPNITMVVKGSNEIYDPRTATTGWSNNPALIVAHYLCNDDYGYGAVYADEIDATALVAAANICDERVSAVYAPSFTADATTNIITIAAGNSQIYTGEPVKVATVGSPGGLPAPLAASTVYYLIRLSDTTASLATTNADALAGTAIDITTAGSGTNTIEHNALFTAEPTTDLLTFEVVEKTMFTGDGVRIETTGAAPGGLAVLTTYYYIRKSDTTGQLATNYANSLAGTAINITDAGTGIQTLKLYNTPRYTCNGTFTTDEKPGDVLQKLLSSMMGRITNIGGTWKIFAGAYVAPTITLTASELRGAIEIQVMPSRSENANSIKGIFVSPENNWQPTDFPALSNATYVAADNGETVWKDIELPFTTRTFMAQRISKIALERMRQGLTFKAPCRLSAFRCQPGDTINFTFAKYGWAPKIFEVIEGAFSVDEEGLLAYDMTLRETASAIYDWTATEGTVLDIAPNTTLPTVDEMRDTVPLTVSGLQLFGLGTDTVFAGRDAKFIWRKQTIYGPEFGSEIAGANSSGDDNYFYDFAVRILTGSTVLRNEYTPNPFYTYTWEKNAEDNSGVPVRTFTILVWQRSKYGKVSEKYARLDVSNSAPTIAGVTVTQNADGFTFGYTRPSDTDWDGIKVYASTSNGFTPGAANLVYDGVDTMFTVKGFAPGVAIYYRYQLRDVFGPSTISDQSSVSPSALYSHATNSPSTSLLPVGTDNSGTGTTIMASIYHAVYPAKLPTLLGISGYGQVLTSAGISMGIQQNLSSMAVTSLPSAAGTITVGSPSGLNHPATGSGTNFTLLAVGDWIYTEDGDPLFWVQAITNATSMNLRMVKSYGPSPGACSVSGKTFTAYRGTEIVLSPTSNNTDFEPSVSSQITTLTGFGTISTTSGIGIFSALQGANYSFTGSVESKNVQITSNWNIGI